jgi:hypothetical protein
MTTTTAQISINLKGRTYTIHTDQSGSTNWSKVYRVTGARKADGALTVHTDGPYAGRAIITGISALDRLNWWEVSEAIKGLGL